MFPTAKSLVCVTIIERVIFPQLTPFPYYLPPRVRATCINVIKWEKHFHGCEVSKEDSQQYLPLPECLVVRYNWTLLGYVVALILKWLFDGVIHCLRKWLFGCHLVYNTLPLRRLDGLFNHINYGWMSSMDACVHKPSQTMLWYINRLSSLVRWLWVAYRDSALIVKQMGFLMLTHAYQICVAHHID